MERSGIGSTEHYGKVSKYRQKISAEEVTGEDLKMYSGA